jgi:GT2 family glycosyltransferase
MVISKRNKWSEAPMGEKGWHLTARTLDATAACHRAAVDAAMHSAMALAGGLLMQCQKAMEPSGEIPAEQNIYDLIVPNFNAPEVLKACLDSLIATTDPKHVIHVIDDASTDPRVDPMVRSYVARHPHIRYYRLPVNLGFPGAVNAGFASTARDVILVNSDTEYPPNWLARMDRCRRSDPAIHAVCPLSNNATICSVPGFNQKNVLPPNTTLVDMDRLVQQTSLRRYPRTPTVVGFCMLMTRQAIENVGPFDMIFGRGYGEEVDWCQRAWARGYASVICDDVYVYHHGEVGFSQVPEKQVLRQTNERLVAKRWPCYEPSVRAYCAANPLRFQQQRMFEALRHRSDTKLRVLHVTHNFDALAGTELFIRQLVDGMRDDAASTVMFPAPLSPFQDGVVEEEGRGLLRGGLLKVRMNGNLFSTEHSVHGVGISFRSQLTERFFAEVLAGSGASIVQFNHLANLGSLELPLVAKALGASVVVVLHDYFLLCPDWNLLHANGKACGEPRADSTNEKCIDCLGRKIQTRSSTPFAVRDIIEERSWHCHNILEQADALVAPSEFVRDQFTRAWGTEIGGRIRVIPHGTVAHPYEADYAPQSSLRVAFLGNATVQKGIDTFSEAARLLLGSSVHFRIIGPMPLGSAIRVPGNVEQSGSYPQRELSRRLQSVDVVFIGSIANETYCFTVDESFRAGVPVIATAMGAIPERVADGKTGILIPPGDALALVSAIERLDRDRALLAAMRRNVGQLSLRSTKETVTAYGQLYAELISDGANKEAGHVALGEGSMQFAEAIVGLEEFAGAKGLDLRLPMVPERPRSVDVSHKRTRRT